MPWLIYRYMLVDLLKTITLTTGVLVTVIAFGAAIKPLASGLLAPTDVAKYVGLAIVPMLQFALPFAAGFGSTIVFHRLTSENEIHASAVCGISYRKLIAPIFASGIFLTIIMFVLLQLVIPHFLILMQKTATKDITRLFQAAVRSNEAFVLGNMQIYANDLIIIDNPEIEYSPDEEQSGIIAPRPKTRMILRDVVAAEITDEGLISSDISAEAALIDLYDIDGRTWMKLLLTNSFVFKSSGDQLAGTPIVKPDPIPLPDNFKDHPKLMTLPRLLEIRANPDQFRKIIVRRMELAGAIHANDISRKIEEQLQNDGHVIFTSTIQDSSSVWYEIDAERLRSDVFSRAGAGLVKVSEYIQGSLKRTIEGAQVRLLSSETNTMEPYFELEFNNCVETTFGPEGEVKRDREATRISNLTTSGLENPQLFELSTIQLKEIATGKVNDQRIDRAIEAMDKELEDVDYETGARIWHRTSLSTTGFLLLMLGSLLAMAMRNSLPLSIYLVAFLPAIGAILLLSGGEQMYRDSDAIGGHIALWSGNVALAVIAFIAYLKISRN